MCCCAVIAAILLSLGLCDELWPDEDTGENPAAGMPPDSNLQFAIAGDDHQCHTADDAAPVPSQPCSPLQEQLSAMDGQPAQETSPEVTPLYVRTLTPITSGQNDGNPTWSPDGRLVAFERSIGDKRELIVANRNGVIVRTIYLTPPGSDQALSFFFPGVTDTASYSAGLCWSPDSRSLAFMSNAGSGNYDIYLLPDLMGFETIRLTRTPEKDSHPQWSPAENRLLFVSGRTGKADIFSLTLPDRHVTRMTRGSKMFLYPQWSPDGKRALMIYGSNENHDIYMMDIAGGTDGMNLSFESLTALTTWRHDDLRPVWSPDGTKVAFYSNRNNLDDPKQWALLVVSADASTPTEGEELDACIVARRVIPDIDQGPAWMPDSRHIAYVRDDEQAFHPIYLVDTQNKISSLVRTGTKMNHDIACAEDGTLAFRAQVEQWDHIHLARVCFGRKAPKRWQ